MITKKTVVDFAEVMKAYGLTKLELKDDEKYILLETGRVSSPEANEDRLFTKDEEFESVKEEAPEKEPETKDGYVQKSIVNC